MTTELLSFDTPDGLQLPGLLFKPTKQTKHVLIWLHGMGDNGVFYNTVRANAMATALTDNDIALLLFNNRGAHNKKSLQLADVTLPEEDRGYLGGTHYEKIADCKMDIDGAVTFLKHRGFSSFFLGGHSSGANKICSYDSQTKDNPFRKYVLAGPGDDIGLFYSELGEKRFWNALEYARKKIAADKPLSVMPLYTGMNPFSAQAAADILNPDGDYNTFPFFEATQQRLGKKPLLKEYAAIKIPMQVIIGENDEYTYTAGSTTTALNLFRENTNKSVLAQCDFVLLPDTDHGFHGKEAEFAETISSWLTD